MMVGSRTSDHIPSTDRAVIVILFIILGPNVYVQANMACATNRFVENMYIISIGVFQNVLRRKVQIKKSLENNL